MTSGDTDAGLELAIFVAHSIVTISLEGKEIVVGRDELCDVRIEDASVSRRHASLRREEKKVYLRDLGSANGTFLRDVGGDGNNTVRLRPIRGETTVEVGAVIHFGTVLGIVRRAPSPHARAIVVADPAMRAVHDRAARIATSLLSVLLLGETGVGKEVIARAIHDRSPRAANRFLALNCGAIAPTLLESELFGHEKGAFTGAFQAKTGLLESANGGTVFLDEIGEMPLDVQVKLLRVLEERVVLSVGGRVPRPIDVRIVAATHRDLEADCRAGRFRRDLFFRLEGVSIRIPPLRERPAELLELARFFLTRACEVDGRASVPVLSASAEAMLMQHAWPGNVRELRNAMELAAVLATGNEIGAEHLPDRLRMTPPLEEGVHDDATERARILEALERCGGNQTQAADLLGISRRTLVSRLTEYGLTRPRKPRA